MNWNKTITDKELILKKKERLRTFITSKAKETDLPRLVDEGWLKVKDYKSCVLVRKDKPDEEQFIDKLWLMFANMGFTEMNEAFELCIPYGDDNQIYSVPIFAADNETVIIAEVKYSEIKERSRLSDELEFFQYHIGALQKAIRLEYPKAKIKFIWITHNLIMEKKDLNQMSKLHIVHFDDSSIVYYSELVKHIGSASKYQLLGNLFAKQDIVNMDNRIPAIQGKMGGHTYYSFSIEPEKLLKIGYVLHRNKANAAMMPTYQRLIKKKRLKEVKDFVNNGGYFPNSIIISIDTEGKGLEFELAGMKVDSAISRIGILHLPKKYHSAYIIDGQHRLYGYSDSKYAMTNSIPVVAFLDLDRSEQIKLFMDINENQKAVPKTLRVTLNADMLWDSDNFNEQRQALRSKIAQMLGEKPTSPLNGRIIIGEGEQTAIKAVSVEAVQKAIAKTNFFSTFDKNNKIQHKGSFDLDDNEKTCALFYPFIEEFMLYFQNNCNYEWERDDGEGILVINRGIYGLIRILDDIVNMLVDRRMIFPEEQSPQDMVELIGFYLNPLVDYIHMLTPEERKDLKSYLGEGGFIRFWRTFQKVINNKRRDFNPEGLENYWLNESKTYNEDSAEYIKDIEDKLKGIIQDKLETEFGDRWFIDGLPKKVYSRINKAADNARYEAVRQDEYDGDISPWDFADLSDCRDVVIYGKNWQTLFSAILIRPQDENINGNKELKTKWIADVNDINRKMASKNYSVTLEQHTLLASIYEWISGILI